MPSRRIPLMAMLCLAIASCSDGGSSESDEQSNELVYVQDGKARCFPDQGRVVLEVDGVPVTDATVDRYARLLRRRNPKLREDVSRSDALRKEIRGVEQPGILRQAAVYAHFRDRLPELTKKALALLDRLKKGEEFEEVAREASDDSGSKDRGGHLGRYMRDTGKAISYLSLQDVAWTLGVGEVSDPVVSDFGIHLLKVKREIPGTSKEKDQRELLQILIAFDPEELDKGTYRSAFLANVLSRATITIKDDEYKTLIPDHLWHR